MTVMLIHSTILTAFLAVSLPAGPAHMQETSLTFYDLVQAPGEWTGWTGSDWHIAFRETWNVDPERPAITKHVENWVPRNDSLDHLPDDSLRKVFTALVSQNEVAGDGVNRNEVNYEFVLLEPHAASPGVTGFPEPDSMDPETRRLQEALIDLIEGYSQAQRRFNLKEQLLSVWFRETWEFDPATMEITRLVRSITPVIWQRRKTTEGEAIDEPATGYPVYFKNRLQPILLRNP